MGTVRAVIFLLGCALMLVSLFVPVARLPDRGWFTWSWLWFLGATIAIASHGWPDIAT